MRWLPAGRQRVTRPSMSWQSAGRPSGERGMLSVLHGVALLCSVSACAGRSAYECRCAYCNCCVTFCYSSRDDRTRPVTGDSNPELLVECLPCLIISKCARGSGMIVLVRPAIGGWPRVARFRFAGHAGCPLCWGSPRRRAPRVTAAKAVRPPSSSGLGHRPFKAAARVRIPLGAPLASPASVQGPVEQSVSSPPCQGGGRGFKSRQDRSAESA